MCTHCAKYGHSKKNCKTKQARCLKCSGGHSSDTCSATALKCPHCGGPHAGWNRKCPTLLRHLNSEPQEKYQDQHQSPPKKISKSTATETNTIEAAVQTTRKIRFEASSQTKKATREAGVQAGQPTPTVETSNDSQSSNSHSGWWLRSCTQAREGAAPPPAARNDEDQNPELNDPDLFPQPKQDARTDDKHPYIFKYADERIPPSTTTRLYRYEKSVRVVDLDLRPGSRAHKAATNGCYFDGSFGKRLYLKRN